MKVMLVFVTGTPGAGKSHFARYLAKMIRGAKVIEVNEVAERHGAFSGRDRSGARIVNLGRLNAALREEVRGAGFPVVIAAGHLIPDMTVRGDVCVVVRSGLARLIGVMRRRGYPGSKISDNVIAEALDYCGVRIRGKAGEVYEVETAAEKARVARYIAALAAGWMAARPRLRDICKMGELAGLIGRGALPLQLQKHKFH